VEFAFTQEQEELRREARSFLEANPEAPLSQLRELGWLGVSVPEERGGGGLSFVDEAILFEEAGRVLYPGPFLTTAVVLPALPAVDEQAWSVELDGLVPHLDTVDRVLTEDGTAVEATGETLPTVDETRPLGRLVSDRHKLDLEGEFEPVRLRLLGGLAAEAVGVAQKALELGVEYVSQREQFGKKIGTYQAVSHPLADTYVETELARSLAYWAAWCVAEGTSRRPPPSRPPRACPPRPPSRPASARSRCTEGSASPGNTSCTATTSAPSGSTRSAATPRDSARSWPRPYSVRRHVCPFRRMRCSS
jgi:hypothetical protein